MKKMKIGIASLEQQKRRTMEIASGKRTRARGEPRVWFTSLKSAAEVLDRNRELLRLIYEKHPDSIQELSAMTGRTPGNLSRSIKRLEACGIVEVQRIGRKKRPIAKTCEFEIEMNCASEQR